MPPLETRTVSPGETPQVPQDPCQHWRGILRFPTDSTQRLRPRHQRGRNPERPPSNSHGDWPFLWPPEQVPEVPVVSREHLPQLKKILEVLPSRWDEAHFSLGVSRLITPNLWNFHRVLHTLPETQEVPHLTRLHSRGSTRVPPTSREAPFPPSSSRAGILSPRGGERIPGVPVASQEEPLSTGKARGIPGSCHHSQSPPDVPGHSRETCFPYTASTFNPRIDSHLGGTWDSPVGKPGGKAKRESHRSLDPRKGKRDTAASPREESARACPNS